MTNEEIDSLIAAQPEFLDDPSEVRPGDVRTVEGVIGMVWDDGASFTMRGAAGPTMFSSAELATSTLIRRARRARRAKPEIKVGMRVKRVDAEDCCWVVDEFSQDGRVAILTRGHGVYDMRFVSDLTPVEDKADGKEQDDG